MSTTPQTVDEYIQSFPPEIRAVLESVRNSVLASVPGGEERLSYRMPAVFLNGVVVYYAAFKKHLGVFPPVQDQAVRANVAQYAGPKGNLQFPFSEPIPLDLIAQVVQARLASNLAKASKGGSGARRQAKTSTARAASAA
jgi:uncharacterized protein YdhG (YjbR/CyaY superfamily)